MDETRSLLPPARAEEVEADREEADLLRAVSTIDSVGTHLIWMRI